MLIEKNTELYEEYAKYITVDTVRDAFHVLIGAASTLAKFSCYPERKGEIQDFRYYSADDKQPFAFIINKHSLLFYLRAPALDTRIFGVRVKIRNLFQLVFTLTLNI